MIALERDRTRTLLAIHGWAGVLLGLLLYVVIATGVVAVFADEIGDWASPIDPPAAAPFPAGLGLRIAELTRQIDPAYVDELNLYPRAGGRIEAFFHRHISVAGDAQPHAEGAVFELHPRTLEVLSRRDGIDDEVQARDTSNALAAFLVDLHVSLHLPAPYGYFVTGVLGLAMMVAAVTGLLVHRHLLKELFTIRRFRDALLARRDRHVVAASWNLPFAFVLAFTGSYFSFAGSIGIPVMAMVAFGGDQTALIEAIVGTPPTENPAPAPMADLDGMLADAARRAGTAASFVSVSHYGRADAQVTVFTPPAAGELISHNLVYDGSSGAFVREKPGLGLVPSAGGALAAVMAPLHFGNFAGLLSKSVWFALGFASCYVTLTGLQLWTTRRAESPPWRAAARVVIGVGYGLPLALAATPIGYFAGRVAGVDRTEAPMLLALAAAAALTALLGTGRVPAERNASTLLRLTGAVLLSLPLLRWASGGPGWITASAHGLTTLMSMDAVLIAGAWLCWRAGRPRAAPTALATNGDAAAPLESAP